MRKADRHGGRATRAPLPRWKRYLLTAGGVASLGLGALGVVLPLLPTTPFLLLAAACFFQSSDRLYDWLMRHRWFGPYIRNHREHRAITLGAKVGLLEKESALGGLATLGIVTAWLPLYDGRGRQVIGGLGEELLRLSVADLRQERQMAHWSGVPNC